MIASRNFTKYRHKHAGHETIVLSIGKSGRTWLRVLLNKFLSLHYHIPFELGDLNKHNAAMPSIGYDHELWKHFSEATIGERIRGKYLISRGTLFTKKVILLYRDPRDVVVSLYFQKTKRSQRKIAVSISDFLRHKKFGIQNIIRVMNEWKMRLNNHPHCLWLSYEGLKADTAAELAKILDFMGMRSDETLLIREAVEFSKFENMKKMEAQGDFKEGSLRPGDPKDANSFKVREGKVGGYERHFSAEDLAYINQAMLALDTFYGYKTK